METQTLTLTDFLLARIAEDEEVATRTAGYGGDAWADDDHQERWTPARVLAECEAKRRIVEHLAEVANDEHEYSGWTEFAEKPLRLLALPYADHPGYRQEWRA